MRPGDVVVVTRDAQAARPAARPKVLVLPSPAPVDAAVGNWPLLQLANPIDSTVTVGNVRQPFERTLTYLPKGLAHAVLAPLPWRPSRALDLLTVPEMLLWYLMIPSAAWTLWRARGRRLLVLPMLLFVAAALGVFALAEGNTGTLYRHRAMVIPLAAILASPGLVALLLLMSKRVPRLAVRLAEHGRRRARTWQGDAEPRRPDS